MGPFLIEMTDVMMRIIGKLGFTCGNPKYENASEACKGWRVFSFLGSAEAELLKVADLTQDSKLYFGRSSTSNPMTIGDMHPRYLVSFSCRSRQSGSFPGSTKLVIGRSFMMVVVGGYPS
jgi:hypothetical protein